MALRPGGFHFARSLVVSVAITVAMFIGGTSAVAAKSTTVSTTTTGNDISFPQCGRTFPSGQAFGIVGVNGGLANDPNPCLGGGSSTSELHWAWQSLPSTTLPTKVGLYVNTADPGPTVLDWPTADHNGYSCVGSDSPACAWQYGWERAKQDIAWLEKAAVQVSAPYTAALAYTWWLDVETANSWETGSGGLLNNVADLQGMVAALEEVNVPAAQVGIYSTSYQWKVITGGSTTLTFPGLEGLNDWIPGARTLSAAKANCTLPSFTAGSVTITQWFAKPYDGDWICTP